MVAPAPAFTPLADAIEGRHFPCGRERGPDVATQIAHYGLCTDLGCIQVDEAFQALWFAFRRGGALRRRRTTT